MGIVENVGRPLVGLLNGNADFYYFALETHKGPPYITFSHNITVIRYITFVRFIFFCVRTESAEYGLK